VLNALVAPWWDPLTLAGESCGEMELSSNSASVTVTILYDDAALGIGLTPTQARAAAVKLCEIAVD